MSRISMFRGRRRAVALGLVFLAVAGVLQFANANPAVSQSVFLNAYKAEQDPGLEPGNGVWDGIPSVQVPLTAQTGVYAAGGGSIPFVAAKAVHYNNKLYVRLEWDDASVNDSTVRVQDFSDAVAVEFPAKTAASVPSICMGQADAGVNIWQWRADSQKGLKDPGDVYTNTLVDMYPSKDTLFYTARAVGNPYANPDGGPIQTLISRTFGALTPAATQDVQGKGVRDGERWAVVLTRGFAGADGDQATFAVGSKTDMAIAVWNGAQQDRNGRKSVSQFVTLNITSIAPPEKHGVSLVAVGLALALLIGVGGLGAGLAFYGARESRMS